MLLPFLLVFIVFAIEKMNSLSVFKNIGYLAPVIHSLWTPVKASCMVSF